jgi:hypothetical protein
MNLRKIIIIIFILCIAGFLIWYYGFNKSEELDNSEDIQQETIALDGDKYVNDRYNFSLSLPKDWKVMDEDRRINNPDNYDPDYSVWLESSPLANGSRQSIWIYIMEMRDFDKTPREAYRGYNNMSLRVSKEIIGEEDIEIAGIPAVHIIRTEAIGEREDICFIHNDIMYVLQNAYPIEGEEHSEETSNTFYQVVSSFTFN